MYDGRLEPILLRLHVQGEEGTTGTVDLGTNLPSKILRFLLEEYRSKIVFQEGSLLVSSTDAEVQMEFTKKFTAFFGVRVLCRRGWLERKGVFCNAGVYVADTIRVF